MLSNRVSEKKERRSYLSCEARLLPGSEKDKELDSSRGGFGGLGPSGDWVSSIARPVLLV